MGKRASTSTSTSNSTPAPGRAPASAPASASAPPSAAGRASYAAAASVRYIVLKNSKSEFFILLSLLYIFSAVIVNEYIIHDELYYRSLGGQLSLNVIDQLISFRNKWQWVGYIGVPLILAIKFLLVATFLSMGSLVAGHRLTFRQIFAMAMVAEVVYLAASYITTGTLLISGVQTLEDLNVSILSLASLFPHTATQPYINVPLQSISLFLAAYILFLTWCYKTVTGHPFRSSFSLVLTTYGTAFFMWIILVMYLLISYG
ncbi:MAG: hypothetical protein EA408_11115 [Marinilabiliales bacterium]|nr:MAG: hypothetical protein EA408_11115 [Marinilabiliales bacterium]